MPNIVLLTIDFIILVFACWGLASGMETSGYCCIICTTLGCEECFTCIVKAALTCPLLLQFLIGLANVGVILGIILGYHIAKSSINSLNEKLNIDRINIDLINNQIFDILFLVAFFLITVLTIVLNASGLFTASSARILRSTLMFLAFIPAINCE